MWPNPQETEDLVTFTEEILNGKLHFLCSVTKVNQNRVEELLHITQVKQKDNAFMVLFCLRIYVLAFIGGISKKYFPCSNDSN